MMPNKKTESEPESLFKCRQCGDCCKGYGGTFVTNKDILAISKYINTSSQDFIKKFCQFSGSKPILAQGNNGFCVFWDKVCKIHPVKPKMCKDWPYLESVLIDIGNWSAMASTCPGIHTNLSETIITKYIKEFIQNKKSNEIQVEI